MATVPEFPTVEQPAQNFPKADVVVSLAAVETSKPTHNMVMSTNESQVFLGGASTKDHTANLKTLGGTWNKGIKMWSFDISHKKDVDDFIAGVESGKIKAEPSVGYVYKKPFRGGYTQTSQGPQVSQGSQMTQSSQVVLPTVSNGFELKVVNDQNFQTVGPWKIFVPKVGMVATIKVGNQLIERVVSSVNGDRIKGYIIIVDDNAGNKSQLQLGNGHWEVRGLMPMHSIRFDIKK